MSKCLLTAIRAHNAETIAWTAGGLGRMAPLLTEDLFYWGERRVYDADDLLLHLDAVAYARVFEDAYGLPPPADLRRAFLAAEPSVRANTIEEMSRLPPLTDPEYDELVEG